MKILSLFDGISIAQQAFKELGFEVEYYASEIDKNAIEITQKNHPNTEQLGDIKDMDCSKGLLHYGKGKPFYTGKQRTDYSNLILVCRKCHTWIHSKRNTKSKLLDLSDKK